MAQPLSDQQILTYASLAGFTGNSLIIAGAIAKAESGGDPGAIGPVGEVGLWQVYPKAHPTYNVGLLSDPLYNAKAAYTISNSGTNWNPWTTYKNGQYSQFYQEFASLSLSKNSPAGSNAQTVDQIFDRLKLEKWYREPHANYFHGSQGTNPTENGQDCGMGRGFKTPVGAIAGGSVIYAQQPPGYEGSSIGYIIVLVTTNGNNIHWYQHMATSNVKVGDHISVGQTIGLSGGLPVDQYSNGQHIEFRMAQNFDATAVKSNVWGITSQWQDPLPYLNRIGASVADMGVSSTTPSPFAFPSLADIQAAWDKLNPNADIVALLQHLDAITTLQNPFNVDDPTSVNQQIGLTSRSQYAQLGDVNIAGADIRIGNPLLYVEEVAVNVAGDIGVLLIRAMFALLAFYVAYQLTKSFIPYRQLGRAATTVGGFIA